MGKVIILLALLGSVWDVNADPIDKAVNEAAAKYNIRPKLLKAIIKVESNGNPKAVGKSHGEIGLMQLRREYFPAVTHDIKTNVTIGARYLAELKEKKKNEYGCAWFVAFNVGPNLQLKHPKLHPYFKKVLAVYPEVCKNQDASRGDA
jgi:soluble lytic murein transglycosylase-like protein